MSNLISTVTANGKKGRLDVSSYGIDNKGVQADFGDYVEYYVKTINPRNGSSSFKVAHIVKILNEEEFMEKCNIIHKFEGVIIKPRLKQGRSVHYADGSENRWHGEKSVVFNNRKNNNDIANVIVRENGFIEIESDSDQSQEPEFVFDIVSYRTNTKNQMYYYRFDEMAYTFESCGGHANIRYYTCLVITKYGTKIAEPSNMRGKVLAEYTRPVVESNEKEIEVALSAKGYIFLRNYSENATIGFKKNFSDHMIIEVTSSKVTVHVYNQINKKYSSYRHRYVRRSELREIFDNLTGVSKEVEPTMIFKMSQNVGCSKHNNEQEDRLTQDVEFVMSNIEVLEEYEIVREESTRYTDYVLLSYWITKGEEKCFPDVIKPCINGFPPIIRKHNRFAIPLIDKLFPEFAAREKKFFVTPAIEELRYDDIMAIYSLWLRGWSVYTLEVEKYENEVYVFDPVVLQCELPKRISKESQMEEFDNILKDIPEEYYRKYIH